VCPVPHLFGENVSRIDASTDVEDIQSFILDPFTDRVLVQFHVSDLFRSHGMRPLDASCIIIERGEGVKVSEISNPLDRTLSAKWRMPMTDLEASFVAWILASLELRAV
jgi:hypothetical protein